MAARKSREPACKLNPRLCKEAPNNRLADAIRSEVMKWPDIRKRLRDATAIWAGLVRAGLPPGNPQREKAAEEWRAVRSEIDAIFKALEETLSTYAGEPTDG